MDKINFKKVFNIILVLAYELLIILKVPAETFNLQDLACVIFTLYIIHIATEV